MFRNAVRLYFRPVKYPLSALPFLKLHPSLTMYEYLFRLKHFKKENVFFVGTALITAGPLLLRQSQSRFVLCWTELLN